MFLKVYHFNSKSINEFCYLKKIQCKSDLFEILSEWKKSRRRQKKNREELILKSYFVLGRLLHE